MTGRKGTAAKAVQKPKRAPKQATVLSERPEVGRSAFDENGVEQPHSLLFLSCDLVGSTKFKQDNPSQWRKVFLEFYRGFPQLLDAVSNSRSYPGSFHLWKPIGDELIFTTRVEHEHDICLAIRIWLETLNRYESETLSKMAEPGPEGPTSIKGRMATKGSAFVATFPDPDSHSSIPRHADYETRVMASAIEKNREALKTNDHKRWVFDYFGTSIDTGFRVASRCDRRFFTMSIEVVHALTTCYVDKSNKTGCKLKDLRLLDTTEFKGVWDGREYPLFALDRQHKDSINKSLARVQNEKVNPAQVRDLCERLMADDNWPSRMYLPKSRWPMFLGEPSDPWGGETATATDDDGLEEASTFAGGTDTLDANPPLGD